MKRARKAASSPNATSQLAPNAVHGRLWAIRSGGKINMRDTLSVAAIIAIGTLAMATPAQAQTQVCSARQTQDSKTAMEAFVGATAEDYTLSDQVLPRMRARAQKFETEAYIQHHPGLASGREAFARFHTKWFKTNPPQPHKPTDTPDTELAQCDMVLMMHHIPRVDHGRVYESFLFDLFRVKGEQADEHWDSFITKWNWSPGSDDGPDGFAAEADPANAPTLAAYRALPPLTEVNSCSAETLRQNRALPHELERVADHRASSWARFSQRRVASNFTEHNPLLASGAYQGRSGFVRAVTTRSNDVSGVTMRFGKPGIVLADCNYVLAVKKLVRRDHTSTKHETFDTFWFDLWAVRDGRIAAHWDPTLLNADYHWDEVAALNPSRVHP